MRVTRGEGPEGIRTLWPDTREVSPKRPPLTEAERELRLREKWSSAVHPKVRVRSGDARRKNPDGSRWEKRREFAAPVPEKYLYGPHRSRQQGGDDGSNPVGFFGGASRGVPETWGDSLGAAQVRESGKPRMAYVREDEAGNLVRGTAARHDRALQVGWRGGAERVPTRRGYEVQYPASDKLPCPGSDREVEIVRREEKRAGKRGDRIVVTYRSTCPVCRQARDVPRRIADPGGDKPRPAAWKYPEHRDPVRVVRSLVIAPDPTTGDGFAAGGGERDDPRYLGIEPRDLEWMRTTALVEAQASDRDTVRGMAREIALYRGAIARGENLALPIYLAVEYGPWAHGLTRIVERRGVVLPATPKVDAVDLSTAKGRAEAKARTMVGDRPVANGTVRDVTATDIEIARVRRVAKPMILCDAMRETARAWERGAFRGTLAF